MTPAQEQALIAATAAGLDNDLRAAFDNLLERIQRGEEPRAATEAVMLAFSGQYAAVMRTALAGIMANAMGDTSPVPITTSAVQLSARLYAQAPAVSGVVASIVNAHQQGFQDARALTLQLFEGYGFRPPSQEPLKISPRNPVLPKYLRELARDPALGTALQRHFAKAQAASLKTGNLQAAYLEAIDAIEQGKGQQALQKKLQAAFYEKVRYYAQRIAQTELHRNYMAREARLLMDDADVEYVQIRRSSGKRSHGRCICDLMAGSDKYGLGPGVYPKHAAPMPPFHPFCLPGDALITSAIGISAVSKRWYDGDMVVVTTASGKRITATINHPILTSGGWVAAGLLNVGGDVISRAVGEPVSGYTFRHDDHQHMPTSIAEIADTFLGSGQVTAREMPVSAEHFHGDGVAGQIAVIGAYRELWDSVDAASSQSVSDLNLQVTDSGHAGLFGDGVFDLGLKAASDPCDGLVGVCSKCAPLLGGQFGHPDFASFASASDWNPGLSQNQVDAGALNAKPFSDGETGLPGNIGINDGLNHVTGNAAALGFGDVAWSGSHGHTSLNESLANDLAADSALAANILSGESGAVIVDAIVDVNVFAWSGHVYNLETEHGHYSCSDIITHNCRCVVAPRLDLTGRKTPQERGGADAYFLRKLGQGFAAQVMGSQAKAQAVLDGADAVDVHNAKVPDVYKVRPVGSVV